MASKSEPEQGDGDAADDGAMARKAAKLAREMGSATTLEDPGIQERRKQILRAVQRSTANVSIAPVISLEE